jgi:hypothetical protein
MYKIYRQRNNYLSVFIALYVSTSTGHPQVLQVSHIQLLNCNIHVPICIHLVRKRLFSVCSVYELD